MMGIYKRSGEQTDKAFTLKETGNNKMDRRRNKGVMTGLGLVIRKFGPI